MNYDVCILNVTIIILRQKDFGCGKLLWRETQKESFMLWLRNWSYLITSSSSSSFTWTPEKLENLLAMVAPRIMRSLLYREAIEPREWLCVTLRYLASGDSWGTIAASYRISPVTVSHIINKTCLEIWNLLL